MTNSSRPARVRLGGIAWALSTVVYLGAQILVASAWNPPYDWSRNYISDLGNTACGPFSLGGPAVPVCSPLHDGMNAAFIAVGVLTLVGAVLGWTFWPHRRLRTAGLTLIVLAGVAKTVVGLVPENVNPTLHTIGSLNIPLMSVGILLLSLAVRRAHAVLAAIGIVVAVVGIAGVALTSVAMSSGGAVAGLGVGGWERIGAYPSNAWVLVIGVLALLRPAAVRR